MNGSPRVVADVEGRQGVARFECARQRKVVMAFDGPAVRRDHPIEDAASSTSDSSRRKAA